MNRQPQDRSADQAEEQLHTGTAAAMDAEKETFSLEDILNEFGGWTRREAPAPVKETAETAQPEAAQTPSAGDAPEAQPEAATVPEAPAENDASAPPTQEDAESPAPQSGVSQDTVRFTPIRDDAQSASETTVWRYEGEPLPETEEAAPQARRAETRQRQREKRAARQQRRSLRARARKMRRQERPDAVYETVQDALAAYSRKNTLRPRLLGTALLCAVSLVLVVLANMHLGALDLTGNQLLFSVAMLVVLLVQALLCYDVLAQGLLQALRLQFDHLSLLALLTLLSVVDGVFALLQSRLPLCPIVSVQLLLALWGQRLLLQGKYRSARAACAMQSPVHVVREEKAWHGKDCIFRTAEPLDGFSTQLEMPDAARRVMRVYAPVCGVLTLLLALLCSLRGGQNPVRCWTALLAASYPAGVLICYARPFALVARRLQRTGAAVAGWHGARNLSGDCGLVIEDADLFPPANVTLNGMKIYTDRNVGQILGYATAVVETAGSGLVPLFQELLQSQNGRRYTVDTFRRYEGGGLGAEIRGDVVLLGSLAFMRLMRVQLPPDAGVKQAVYVSVNGELAAVFALHYAPAAQVKSALLTAGRANGLTPVLATRDFMLTPQFLHYRYKLQPDRVEFPTVEERARLSSPEAVREPKPGALLAQGSFLNFVSTVTAARSMRSAVLGSLVIALLGSVLGLMMVFFLAFIGSVGTASCWNLMIYLLLWLIPQLLLTAMAGHTV